MDTQIIVKDFSPDNKPQTMAEVRMAASRLAWLKSKGGLYYERIQTYEMSRNGMASRCPGYYGANYRD